MSTLFVGLLFVALLNVSDAVSESIDQDDLNILKATLGKLSADYSDLKQIVSSQSQRLAQVEAENAKLKEYIAKEKSPNTDISKRLLLLNQPVESPIHYNKAAFTARLSQHVTGLGNLQSLIFEDVVSNFGNCYSPNTGVFTAKINGTFFFFSSIMSHANEYLETEIVKNSVRIGLMYSYAPTTHNQGVNGAVVGLKEGDEVWVRHVGQEGSKVYGGSWSSFSGFQI